MNKEYQACVRASATNPLEMKLMLTWKRFYMKSVLKFDKLGSE